MKFKDIECNMQEAKIKVGAKVSISPRAVVCVGKYYDWVSVGLGATGNVLEIQYNELDRVAEARVLLSGARRHSYWFYLDDLTEVEN
jgi:hypothetical protein